MYVRMATFNDAYPIEPGLLFHTPPLFYKLKLLTIFDIFNLQLGKLVYESFNDIGPTSKIIKFQRVSEIHNLSTRHATCGNIFNSYVRTTNFGLKSLLIQGGHYWATLAGKIKECQTNKSFLKHLKQHILKTYLNQ